MRMISARAVAAHHVRDRRGPLCRAGNIYSRPPVTTGCMRAHMRASGMSPVNVVLLPTSEHSSLVCCLSGSFAASFMCMLFNDFLLATYNAFLFWLETRISASTIVANKSDMIIGQFHINCSFI